MPRLCQILKGIKIECGKKGKPSRSHLPVTPTILQKCKPTWLGGNNISFNEIMFYAASLTIVFSYCHSGEITIENEANYEHNTHLSFNDLAVDNAASPSKADQFSVGCQVILGITGDDLCPILAFLDFI